MEDKIYFSKVEFREHGRQLHESILLLNLEECSMSYQVWKRRPKRNDPAIVGVEKKEIGRNTYFHDFSKQAVKMSNSKTDFKSVIIEDDPGDYDVIFSYTYHFTEEEMKELLPYCNALDFEPYRDKKMDMDDEGYCGYRDEVTVSFTGVSDSYMPLLKLPMDYYYDEEHIWPSERLYRYVVKTYFSSSKKLRKWVTQYGACSLGI